MWLDFGVFLVICLEMIYGLRSNINGTPVDFECPDEPACLKCTSAGCVKCPQFIIYPSRRCVDTCPFGHRPKWSTAADYMGKICAHNGNLWGLSNESVAIFYGFVAGTILCTLIITSTVFYVKHKRRTLDQQNIETTSDLDDSPERRDFLKQLETLKPYARHYLEMLNDTRRQVRELYNSGDSGAITSYRPVLRDLAKILLLINRPLEKLVVPEDWDHLFSWAEKTLKRFKRMSEISQPQVAQLINFLQDPDEDFGSRRSGTLSTFKPDALFGSSLSLEDIAINKFNTTYDSKYQTPHLNPQWKFEYSLINPVSLSEFNPELWRNSKEYLGGSLFLDDDFSQLGFRPQDEITTEL